MCACAYKCIFAHICVCICVFMWTWKQILNNSCLSRLRNLSQLEIIVSYWWIVAAMWIMNVMVRWQQWCSTSESPTTTTITIIMITSVIFFNYLFLYSFFLLDVRGLFILPWDSISLAHGWPKDSGGGANEVCTDPTPLPHRVNGRCKVGGRGSCHSFLTPQGSLRTGRPSAASHSRLKQ